MRLWKCSLCGKVGFWGPTWTAYSSLIVDDEWPSYRVIACSPACSAVADAGHTAGTVALPKFRFNHGQSRMSKGPVGYKPQPTQRELIEVWNREHPAEEISTEFTR